MASFVLLLLFFSELPGYLFEDFNESKSCRRQILGKQERSNREGFVFYIKNELRAVKWRDWKLHLVWEPEPNAGRKHLEIPYLFNLIQDPKEETEVHAAAVWVRHRIRGMVHEFQETLKAYPPIPPGAPDHFTPGSATHPAQSMKKGKNKR